jgi:hypothetical protein
MASRNVVIQAGLGIDDKVAIRRRNQSWGGMEESAKWVHLSRQHSSKPQNNSLFGDGEAHVLTNANLKGQPIRGE